MNDSAIFYLTRKNDLWLLRHSIKFLFMNFNHRAKYPVVILHDDLDSSSVSSLMVSLHSDLGYVPELNFHKIVFELPRGVGTDPTLYDPPLSQFRMGYRHMCRLMAGLIFQHQALRDYRYCWRLDSDSFILSPIEVDPFLKMKECGYKYSYIDRLDQDEHFVCKGLLETTQEFVSQNTDMKKIEDWNLEIFYTNFEIMDMDFFRSDPYQRYFAFLDASNNIYYRRWGDAPIRYLASKIMISEDHIWAIKDFCYQHGSWVGNGDKLSRSISYLVPEPYQSVLRRYD